MKRSIVAGTLALVSVATCVALAPTASAAPQACVTQGLTTGGYEGVGDPIRYKSPTSTCNDLNLTYTYNTNSRNYDYYAGRLRRSNGTWFTCSKGYVLAYDGYHSVNDAAYTLCTDVNDNTPFTVASYLDGSDNVQVTH
ncbi:hypothetical protein ACQEVG_17625 [Streptomyces sp. CA-135486]|uniref:hypothetical protein n=1 Tax=Streptomyces sp. CA-135486 TaxID=3240049 RepID=UPI003D906C73